MTEITVYTDMDGRTPVKPLAFAFALLLAPLVVGIPCFLLIWIASASNYLYLGPFMLAVFPAAAVVAGGPTYLLFGGPFLWNALRKGYSPAAAAFLANMVSLPFVAIYAAFTSGEVIAAISMFAFFGSIFAPLWGAIFAALYQRFGGGMGA